MIGVSGKVIPRSIGARFFVELMKLFGPLSKCSVWEGIPWLELRFAK
jgi:hypothetical protein